MKADPEELVHACSKTLARVDEGLRWAYSAGWFPSRRWTGEPRGSDMRLAGPVQSDKVAGPKDDIGMGDYHARRAVRSAGPSLTTASANIGRALQVLALAHHLRAIPGPTRLFAVESIDTLARAVRQVGAQLDVLAAGGFGALNDLSTAYVVARLTNAESVLLGIDRRLSRWSESVPESRDIPTPLCVTCERRPRPLRKGVVVGRECDTCATYRYRHKGQARPKSLDKDDRQSVIDAAGRRAAAGQGWGMS